MSGGVDSSVAAHLLKEQGYDVVGVFLRCWGGSPSSPLGITRSSKLAVSCAEQDAEDARRVAGEIGIPFYAWDFEKEYKVRVVQYMIEGYRSGITPNPDVMCNREIKFGLFYDRALEMGADFVATGHYVKKTGISLFEAKDKNKDQSYFLWTITPQQIEKCLFPIGDYLKSEVREIAKYAKLSTAEKKDSQGICFLGKVTIQDFLKEYIPVKHGEVVTISGEKVGEHEGAHFYTIGQRHLGVDLKKNSNSTLPYFVASKNTDTNTLVVAKGDDNDALFKETLTLAGVNIISPPDKRVLARVRYRQSLSPAGFEREGKNYKLQFETPQKFVALGQSAVFYSKEGEMLGGGVIIDAQ